ncbi:DNA internalization-related competence protein ComEC/Rec2 [Sporomusa aerivorans]|uniref:DNA internalization-related competence protein ComEC/Rec2 n=1 Tax=Sporomusa aerivorans TaxID=204936 RepID=UPI00352AC2FF
MPTLVMLAIVLLSAALWHVQKKMQNCIWPLTGLFFIAGMIYYCQEMVLPADDISHYAGQTVIVEGMVDGVPEIHETGIGGRQLKYLINVETVKPLRSTNAVRASGKVRIYVHHKDNDKGKPAAYGNKIAVNGQLLELHGYNNPGQIDITMSLKRQGVTARMSAQAKDVKIVEAHTPFSWRERLNRWQNSIIKAMQEVMPVNDAAIITAMLFGGYEGIDKDVVADFTTTGLIHILSVSGAHMALVAGVVRWFSSRIRLGSLPSAVLAIMAIMIYAVMSGLTPPVIRSALMGLISLLAVMLDRENYAPVALAATALVMLIYQPLLLYDISFQLSLGATAGLVLLYQPTLAALKGWPAWLAGPLAVTVSAQLGVVPFIAWYFNNFSVISFVANIIILPGVELIIILGLAGVFIYTVFPAGGTVIFVLLSLITGGIVMLTALLASVPYSSVYIPSVGPAGSLVFYIVLAWVYGWRPWNIKGPRQLAGQWPKTSMLTAVMIVLLLIVANWYPHPVTVHFIDVGQGDATLVITPLGKAVLIDTGGSFGGSNFDIGERVVAPYLKHYGVTAIEYLILTHGHQDHAGGAAGVASHIKIANIMLAREDYTPAVQALLHGSHKAAIIPAYTGQVFSLDRVVFTIIHTPGGNAKGNTAAAGNEASSVIRVSYGQHSFLITGDLEAKGEEELLTKEIPPCTVLKVGHHGSETSTTLPFLQAVNPSFAVISAGYNNRFGHPHPETLARLTDKQNAIVYRTDKHGAIVFTSDGTTIVADTYVK